MEKNFFTIREVASFLCVSVKTIQNRAVKHAIYRPSRPGVYYIEHVKILEKVWAGIVSEEEGLAFWELKKDTLRRCVKNG